MSEAPFLVQVVATSGSNMHRVSFKMRPDTTFGKLMGAWCKQVGVAMDRARFDVGDVELLPSHTPASLGLQRSEGDDALVIHATPKRLPDPPDDEMSEGDEAAEVHKAADAGATGAAKTHPGHARHAPVAGGEEVAADAAEASMHNKADAAAAAETVAAASSLSAELVSDEGSVSSPTSSPAYDPFEQMEVEDEGSSTEASLSPVSVASASSASAASPESSPSMLPSDPSPQSAPPEPLDASEGSEPSSRSKRSVDGLRRVRFRVGALSEIGENILSVTLGPDAPIGRMMDAWCSHHGMRPGAARFAIGGRELRATDTPTSLAKSGVLPRGALPGPGEVSDFIVPVRAVPANARLRGPLQALA